MIDGQGQSAPESIDDRLSAYVDSLDDDQPDAPDSDQAETDSDDTETHDADGADDADESPDEGNEDAADDAEPELIDVEFEGKQYKVPPELKDALLMRKDYTTKTQEVAEQRKQLEAERTHFHQSAALQQQNIQDYAKLFSLDNQIEAYANVNWSELINNDPVEAQKHQMHLTQLKDQRNQLAQGITYRQQQQQQMTLQQQHELVQRGAAQLAREIPNWGTELKQALSKTGVESYGFSADELEGLTDPRMVKVLHDAHQYRALKAKRADTKNKVATAPKFVQPNAKPAGSQKSERNKRALQNFRQRRDEKSAVALLGALDID